MKLNPSLYNTQLYYWPRACLAVDSEVFISPLTEVINDWWLRKQKILNGEKKAAEENTWFEPLSKSVETNCPNLGQIRHFCVLLQQ